MNEWLVALVALDCSLTGKSIEQCFRTQGAQFGTADEWLNEEGELYLSDSGYSRLVMSIDSTGKVSIRLTDNSISVAKFQWGKSAELIADVEEILTKRLKVLLGE